MVTRVSFDNTNRFIKNTLCVPQMIGYMEQVMSTYSMKIHKEMETDYPIKFDAEMISPIPAEDHFIIRLTNLEEETLIIVYECRDALWAYSSIIIVFPDTTVMYRSTNDDILTGKQLYDEFTSRGYESFWDIITYILALNPEIAAAAYRSAVGPILSKLYS